jgi:alpha-tubulin suppressor-like RCC1 family protein
MEENRIEINGIEAQKSTFYPNTQVVVRAYPKENEEFHAWQITGDITLTEDELISNPVVFSMPNADITIDAIFRESREFREDRYVTIFKNIEDAGTARAIDGKIYKKYDDVTLEAIPVTGYSFFRWTSNNLLIEDDTDPNYTFTMPGRNVDIQAFFRPLNYLVTTIDDDNGITKGAGYYEYRSNVYIKPVPNSEQYVFDYWEVDGIEIENIYIEKLVFKMPHNPVTVKAIFKPFTFNVKIIDRTFLTTVEYDSVEIARTEVAISAIAQREHYGFNNWYSDDVIFNDANSIDTTFLMPERDIVIYYSYGQNTRILSFDEFEYGDATGDGSVPSGSNAIIEAIPQNYVDFLGWRIVSGGPLDDFDKEERLSSFTMPDRDVILAPTFRPITFAVSVATQREMFDKEVLRQRGLSGNRDALSATGGSIETVKSSYRPEEDVILFAEAHPGFKFKQWEITYNNNTVINNDPDLVFKMPPYEVEIVGIFKEYIEPMTWTQNLSAIQLGSIFQLKVEANSTGKITFRSLNESAALIGGPNKDQIFFHRDQDAYVEVSIEADDFFEHKSLVRKISPISPASYVVKLHDSRVKYDHNDLLIGGPVEPSYGTVSGSSPTGRMLYIDLVSVVEGVEFQSWDIDTGINTLFYWYGKELPADVPNYGEVKFYSDYQRYIETSNGSGALSMSILMPPNEVHIRPVMDNMQTIIWDQVFTGINLGDAEIQLFAESNKLLSISYRLEECADVAYISSGKLFFSNVGACQITAYNEGDGFYDPVSFTKDISVYADQTITWTQDLSSIGTNELPMNLTASSSMGLNVTYSCSDPSINISGSQILFVPTPPLEGTTVEITASQSGTEFIREADPVTIEATFIDKLTDTDGDGTPDWQDDWPSQEDEDIVWDQDLTSIDSANPITLTATAPTSGRTITYKLSNDTLGSLSGNIFTPFNDVTPPTKLFLTITASAAATEGYKASTITKTLSLLDTDGDGYPDFNDDLPENASEWKDSDGDGVGDNQDVYPLDPNKTKFEEEIIWDQDLSQITTKETTLTATSKTERPVIYSVNDESLGSIIDGNILQLAASLRNNTQIDITAETKEDSRNLGASITKTVIVIDSDEDGIADYEDTNFNPRSNVMSAGAWHTLYLKEDGTVRASGSNMYGQLGDGSTRNSSVPDVVENEDGTTFTEVANVSGGRWHTVYLKRDGTVWAVGDNYRGQFGDGRVKRIRTNPVQATNEDGSAFDGVIDIAAGGKHTVYLKSDRTVWAAGWNQHGQLGDGTFTDRYNPVQVMNADGSAFDEVVSISAGYDQTVYLKSDGTVWAVGDNDYGQLGDGTKTKRRNPVQVKYADGTVLSGIVDISAGNRHTVYLKSDGTVWGAGKNSQGQLGDGTEGAATEDGVNQVNPVRAGITNVVAIAAGGSHTVYLKSDGTVWAAGDNWAGQLGDGTKTNRSNPVRVMQRDGRLDYNPVYSGLSEVVGIFAGEYHTMYLQNDAPVRGSGSNWSGQLGLAWMEREASDGVSIELYFPYATLTLYKRYW